MITIRYSTHLEDTYWRIQFINIILTFMDYIFF